MITIYKYPLNITSTQEVELPVPHKIFSVKEQNGKLMMWAGGDTESPKEMITIRIYGTGQPVVSERVDFIETVLCDNGLVWHVFKKSDLELNKENG